MVRKGDNATNCDIRTPADVTIGSGVSFLNTVCKQAVKSSSGPTCLHSSVLPTHLREQGDNACNLVIRIGAIQIKTTN
jgi:hypothetical protein